MGSFITYRNLLVVFLLCGLWHGASWTFVAWGLYHGLLLVIERVGFLRMLELAPRSLRHFYAMFAIIIGWVLFRSENFAQATTFLNHMLLFPSVPPNVPSVWEYLSHQQLFFILLGIIGATPLARFLVTRLITDRDVEVTRRATAGRSLRTFTDVSFAYRSGVTVSVVHITSYMFTGICFPFR